MASTAPKPFNEGLLVGGLFQGRFFVTGQLGQGGTGVVWEADDVTLRRRVAIKTTLPDGAGAPQFAERFVREATLAAGVDHPNVVRIHDVGTTPGGKLYIVMELVRGVPLGKFIRNAGRADVMERAVGLALQICEALAAVHTAGLIHRDVKPDNVLVTPEGRAVLIDFGYAQGFGGPRLTKHGFVVGTARYMAPERHAGHADARSDIYSLGVVLYEAVAGRSPFPVFDESEELRNSEAHEVHVIAEPVALHRVLPACPPALARLLDRCLAKAPAQRFQSAAELAEALRAVQRELGRASSPGAGDRPSQGSLSHLMVTEPLGRSMPPLAAPNSGDRPSQGSLANLTATEPLGQSMPPLAAPRRPIVVTERMATVPPAVVANGAESAPMPPVPSSKAAFGTSTEPWEGGQRRVPPTLQEGSAAAAAFVVAFPWEPPVAGTVSLAPPARGGRRWTAVVGVVVLLILAAVAAAVRMLR